MNKELCYKESGNIDPFRLVISYLLGTGTTMILGYVYTVITIAIPIPYINFFLTAGLGLILGFIARFLIRFSHVRNKKQRIIFAIIIGILANYFQWTTYILYAYDGTIPDFTYYIHNLSWIVIPKNFIVALMEINRVGLWSIFGIIFNGFALALIWIAEALIIIAGPVVGILTTKEYPYSEINGKWYPKFTFFTDFSYLSAVNKFTQELINDPITAFENLGKGTGLRHTKIHLFYVEQENNQYLTFETIYIEGHGRGKKNSTIVINNFKIEKGVADRLKEKYQMKRERIDVL